MVGLGYLDLELGVVDGYGELVGGFEWRVVFYVCVVDRDLDVRGFGCYCDVFVLLGFVVVEEFVEVFVVVY